MSIQLLALKSVCIFGADGLERPLLPLLPKAKKCIRSNHSSRPFCFVEKKTLPVWRGQKGSRHVCIAKSTRAFFFKEDELCINRFSCTYRVLRSEKKGENFTIIRVRKKAELHSHRAWVENIYDVRYCLVVLCSILRWKQSQEIVIDCEKRRRFIGLEWRRWGEKRKGRFSPIRNCVF